MEVVLRHIIEFETDPFSPLEIMKILYSLDFKLYNMTLEVSECCFYGVLFRIFYTLPEIF